MSAKWEKKGTNDGELTFEIDLPQIQQGLDQAFQRVRKNLTVPGFRKGKVSRTVFKRMYGDAALYEDALNILLPDAYEAAVKESGIDPVDQPQINVDSMDEGKPWVIKATVTVKPEVTLGQYKGLEVPKQNVEVSAKDIDAELEKRREQQAELVVKDDKAAENGDTVVIDYVGTIDGTEFDGGSSKNYSLELGSNSFIPGFEEQLVGHKSGDEVTVNVTFPEDYKAADLAGKAAEFKTTIHEVKVKELPALDDDFAKDLDDDVDTLDELKAKIKKELTDQREEAAKNAVQEAAIKEATDNATIKEVPNAMIEQEVHNQMDQYLGNMQRQGISPKMYYQLTGTSEDDLHKQFEADAAMRVRTNLVLEAIVKAEDIQPTEDQVNEEVKNLASEYNMDEKAVRKALSEDMLKHDIGVKQAIDIITDSAKEVESAKDDADKEASDAKADK
ncbi:MAG: trigger factor [Lacticaseibacillus paracasei]|uniref:trigger factor n=1 Tax=Lacticaseibacillus paracasei TaxID=1597 RepID=UPI00058BD248|nr:trigger factor [Lacticaseibacillus paracasei]ALX88620.1 trigger factor [Lacticaseibacillus paracasei]OPH08031.1 trigger factor [Lacticaseibacillus paracasei]RND66306.1 Trigger factor [Lacticaseibacillus paracasei]RND90600.1 Trigger factor [Lacticaseibacillus paracasei]